MEKAWPNGQVVVSCWWLVVGDEVRRRCGGQEVCGIITYMAIKITYWPAKEGGFLGYMNDYPDYPTQGETLEELKFMLGDILDAIRDGDLEDTAANRMCDSFVHA